MLTGEPITDVNRSVTISTHPFYSENSAPTATVRIASLWQLPSVISEKGFVSDCPRASFTPLDRSGQVHTTEDSINNYLANKVVYQKMVTRE